MMNSRIADRKAFTFAELLLVVVSLAVVLLLISLAPRKKGRSLRVRCTVNLKQVALAFNLWAHDRETRFPMELLASEGGTREAALAGKLLPNFLIISNELRDPALLICPEDKQRKPAKTFASLTTANLSYFPNVDAALTNQNHIIAGDRNLALGTSMVQPGLLEITNVNALSWSSSPHGGGGNIGLIDGSAHQTTTKQLRDLLLLGGSTIRLIIP